MKYIEDKLNFDEQQTLREAAEILEYLYAEMESEKEDNPDNIGEDEFSDVAKAHDALQKLCQL